ncbi:DUF1127 domain-containing protein [Terasakiella sp. A23]|uniref:DUF1127 domain-containing protein n=1 Tax=Terasakiella sp. FCG-A23 TaxID=3080561 RepID=UPI0029535E77|nr:DUF1127 domain-containing protein [Terasakiella sp. A23]MDV7338214.1 DUF1127 domain-containing protein [Terasakiella sp. A23]
MTAVTMNNIPAGHTSGSNFNAPKNFFKALIETVLHELEVRKAIRELNAHSNEQLADMGLRRADIEAAVRMGR